MRIRTALALVAMVTVPLVPSPAGATWTKTCMGYEADVVGTSGPDTLHPEDRNGDGVHVTLGMGGNDLFSHTGVNSDSPTDVYFCGGDGRDEGHGWLKGFNGMSGKDRYHGYDCTFGGVPTVVKSVELVQFGDFACNPLP